MESGSNKDSFINDWNKFADWNKLAYYETTATLNIEDFNTDDFAVLPNVRTDGLGKSPVLDLVRILVCVGKFTWSLFFS